MMIGSRLTLVVAVQEKKRKEKPTSGNPTRI
jgi:hypothetical protein